MATQAATFTATNVGTLRQTMDDVLDRLAQSNNPDIAPAAVTITTDTAGTITFAIAATQSNPAFSRAVTATVA